MFKNYTINMKKVIYIFLILLFLIIISRLIYINIFKYDFYYNELLEKTNLYVYSSSAKRGNIYDVNGKLLVGNKENNSVFYHKLDGITLEEEISLSYKISEILIFDDSASDMMLKNFYLVLNDNGNELITSEEYRLFEERKITSDEIYDLKISRINIEDLSDSDKKAAYIFDLMNNGYTHDSKLIKENVTAEEFAKINELNLPGVRAEITYERYYPYNETIKSILGSVGPIHEENIDEYLKNGYMLNDEVGLSYLEKEYESYLKGEKAIYKVNSNGTLKLIKEETKGSDIYLSIDIDIQLELEKIIKEEILLAKNSYNTQYFSDTFAVIGDPLTGKIIAISGQRYLENTQTFNDITNEIISSSFTVGSTVKGATIAVGYNNDLINPNKVINDSCVKLYLVPEKCSWKNLGQINDIEALRMSSNYFQYLIAINLTGKAYTNNMILGATNIHFDIYRNTLSEFGLGSSTGIDLPGEMTGNKGTIIADDLLLNLSIGQYDTYTTIQLLQYMNTIANDKNRLEISLLDRVVGDNEIIYIKENVVLNTLSISDDDFNRVKTGLNEVALSGTGYGYFSNKYNPVGKTGTSESFLDLDNDGLIDTKTMTLTFAGYAPLNNPTYSIAIISPHISVNEEDNDYIYRITRYISKKITDFLFENS